MVPRRRNLKLGLRASSIMSADEHSFRKLLPGFVIPAGTQVVLKAAKILPDGEQFKPPGSVGIVLESPPDNQHPYLVRFTDGETVTAYFHELALRRREVEDELGEVTRGPAALDHLSLPGRLQGVRAGLRGLGRRPAGNLPAPGPAALVASATAGAIGVQGGRSETRSTGNWKSSCGWP